MSALRDEAKDPQTSPERLHELIHLPGSRRDFDSDAGWCRELVAANPSAAPGTLAELAADMDDFACRLHAARNPSTPEDVARSLMDDPNDLVADAARERLGEPLRPKPAPEWEFLRRLGIDPATGRKPR
ncbi:hypothetical protein [Sinomonas atrocyanea]